MLNHQKSRYDEKLAFCLIFHIQCHHFATVLLTILLVFDLVIHKKVL